MTTYNDFVIRFANVNGSGSASANGMFAKALFRMGIPVATRNIFPSNIQGLPTWYEIRASRDGYMAREGRVDVMVAMNAQTYAADLAEVSAGGVLIYDSTWPRSSLIHRDDVTIIAYGAMAHFAVEAADQLAQLGLGVASIAGEKFSQLIGLAGQGVGILFLKFSRDDENQSDSLGLRYMTRAGYDPYEMPKVFATLDRVSQSHSLRATPQWLSTHPDPGNRIANIDSRIGRLPPELQQGTVGRDSYLIRLNFDLIRATSSSERNGFFI